MEMYMSVAVLKGEAQLPSESCRSNLTIIITSQLNTAGTGKESFDLLLLG